MRIVTLCSIIATLFLGYSASGNEDTHIIVATLGEGLEMGPVQGDRRSVLEPVAVANQIFVAIDGNGFEFNNDNLGIDIDDK